MLLSRQELCGIVQVGSEEKKTAMKQMLLFHGRDVQLLFVDLGL